MKNVLNKISYSRLFFSIIFSIALFLMSKIVFLGGTFQENYIELIFLSEFKILILLIPIVYLLLYILENHYKKIINTFIKQEEFKHKKKFCLVSFIFLFIIFLLYYFSVYPGGVFIDTWVSYNMLSPENVISANNPILYTLSIYLVKAFGNDFIKGFGVYTFLQIILMVSILTYFIYWLLNKKVNPTIVTGITLFLGFFKLYPLYSVSIWKDTPFSLVLFLFILGFIDLIENFKNQKIEIKNIIKFNIYGFLICFLRNNAKFIVIVSILSLFFTYIKGFKKSSYIKNIKIFFIVSILVVIIVFIIESLYPVFGITKTELTESLAIPIQQVARVVVVDGNITKDQKELIEKVLPISRIKKDYRAMLVDYIKRDVEFNSKYLEEHKSEFLKLWFELLIQNPGEYIKAHLLITSGFWTLNVKGSEAYTSAVTWNTLSGVIPNTNLIADNFNMDIKNDLLSVQHFSGGFFFWITAISILITFRISDKKTIIAFIPAIALWIGLMVGAPMAQALRYVYTLVLILPLNIIYPAIMFKDE